MKKWAIRISILLIAVIAISWFFRDRIGLALMASQMEPDGAFETHTPPPAPDFAQASSWAALPDAEDGADFIPSGLNARTGEAEVSVFFVHPTTFLSKTGWNAPLDDKEAAEFRDSLVMRGQASAFNGCCDVYAPKYRQATFWSFIDQTGSGTKAREFAYDDVDRAFSEFIKRIGDKPFILAGHSQGADHVRRLLERRITGHALATRMVAAYPVGFTINAKELSKSAPDIPVCTSPEQTGCYVTWNSLGKDATAFDGMAGAVCVNPLSWKMDGKPEEPSANKGSLSLSDNPSFEPGVTGAQCLDDRLLVGEFQSDMFDDLPMNLGPDNYHVLDYALFYANIRENATMRTKAYLEKTDGEAE